MAHPAPSYPEHIDEELQRIDPTFRLKWEPRCAMNGVSTHRDENGRIIKPTFEGRFELWATDTAGRDYVVQVLETEEGEFKPPGDWLVQRRRQLNPERFGGSTDEMVRRHVEIPAAERERKLQEESDNAVDDGIDWGLQTETPKVGAHTTYHGDRMFSGGSGGEMSRIIRPAAPPIIVPMPGRRPT